MHARRKRPRPTAATGITPRTLALAALAVAVVWFLWLVRDVLPPFLIALVLALLLDPLHDRMERAGVPRGAAVAITAAAFLFLFVGVLAFLLPRAVGQVAHLLQNLPAYGEHVQRSVDEWAVRNAELLRRLNLPPTLQELWQQYQGDILRYLQGLLQALFAGFQASAGKLGWILVVPIVTLYLLVDLDGFRARVYHLIPDAHRPMVLGLAAKVGGVFAAYLRGLTVICAAFGMAVYLVLLLFQLPYALILGLSAAVLYAIPYLGQMGLLVIACLVAWATGRPPAYTAGLAVSLVLVGQLFDQLITPRVIGRQVGLHPVIGLFALMAGNQLFGLGGMVLAVPVAASIRVVLLQLFPKLGEPVPLVKR